MFMSSKRISQASVFGIVLGSVLFGAMVPKAKADISACDQVVGNLVQNCGFEGAAYTSTIGGNTDTQVPVNWVPNSAFDLEPSFNHVTTNPIHSGNNALSIGNFDDEPTPTISQTIADVAGATYTGSFWAYDGGANGDSGAFLQLQVNGVTKVALDDTVSTYNQYNFTFAGTGSDTIQIGAVTNPSEWYVDDVVVTGQAAATPEPSELEVGVVFLLVVAILRAKPFSVSRVKAS